MDWQEFSAHFPTQISKSLVRYVNETVLKSSRYLFVKTVAGVQFAYCTYCNKQHRTVSRLKHKQLEPVKCPHCNSSCQVRAAGVSRKYMVDKAVLVWYEKSKVNPKAITARIIHVIRDYSGDFKEVETQYNCSHLYLFEPGRSYYFNTWSKVPNKSVSSAFDRYFSGFSRWEKFRSDSNIRRAVKGTPFEYSTWEQYVEYENKNYVSDMVCFFDLAARYPCVEYLTKAGMQGMIWAKLYNSPTHGAINWNGKTLTKVLRITKQDIKEARASGLPFEPHHLRYYQLARKKGLPISITEAFIFADLRYSMYEDYYKIALTWAPEKKIIKYFLKQLRKGHYTKSTTILTDWRDYRKQCEELGINLKEEHNLFPNDLHEAHLKLTRRIKMKNDKQLNEKITRRLPDLEKFSFEWNGYLIRPARSSIELFEEGKHLLHCVGGYSNSYAEGRTNIFFVRKKSNPEVPFYTMEVRGEYVVQCRGYDNCDMTPEIELLVKRFIAQKIKPKKNKIKVGIAV
ncbi:PcfJ domain-containing protein [Paenibacillus sp. VCA1]|uniref:PcfJ domain-containing protein n=1 Tax=Paenibacillus sp. VCA1 TaxID=3039148 RepID=UPI002871200C|nr:PcfJ domain-containing protein [Paenibacillus sp. VCA1]MDR9857850.1 PcfJ domain-containing protein [Paenibacillus sp. VCA1]